MNPTPFDLQRAEELLRDGLGDGAKFRADQLEAIQQLCEPNARLLVVQRTGWGKSIVYFIAAKLMRELGEGPCVIVSPLLSLMRNQVEMGRRFGLRLELLDSTNTDDWHTVESDFIGGSVDVLLISPERLGNLHFRDHVLPSIEENCRLLVIDEAHCLSEWGHDFRPDYQRVGELIPLLPDGCSVMAATATATKRVIDDLQSFSNPPFAVMRGNLVRDALRLSVFQLKSHAERLAWLEKFLPRLPGSGIVYTLTIRDAELVTSYLQGKGIDAYSYHSRLGHELRVEREQAFLRNDCKALVATSALGMGFDKSDVGFVVHYQLAPSLLHYYQQIGRAGRMIDAAYVALLWSHDDLETIEAFAAQALPKKAIFERIMERLRREPADFGGLAGIGNVFEREQALKVLEVRGLIRRDAIGYHLVKEIGTDFYGQSQQLRATKLEDAKSMVNFAQTKDCRMQMIARHLGDNDAKPCGKCDNCQPRKPISIPEDQVSEAERFFRSLHFSIEPRQRLPVGEEMDGSRTIPEGLRAEKGLALCAYGDPGFGEMVRRGKYEQKEFGNELIQASADLIRESGLQFDWLTWVPSHDSQLVSDFAQKLADELGVPAREVVRKVKKNQPQKVMRSSTGQFHNVVGVFEVSTILEGRCLLVDDMVDSGWTLTVIAMLLRKAGCTGVVPFALASAKKGADL